MKEQIDKKSYNLMIETFLKPEIQECISSVESIAGFNLSTEHRKPFIQFHNYITNPQPDFITEWINNPKLIKWYNTLTNGILGNVQDSLACVCYHYERLKTIETNVLQTIDRINYKEAIGNMTIALGNTRIVDFEYQAFVLAYRRCLDYFAKAIGAYFKNDFNNFRKLDKILNQFLPNEPAKSLLSNHEKYSKLFEFVLSDGTRKSIRDKIAHYEYVNAWRINLNKNGFILAGGGENMGSQKSKDTPVYLAEILKKHLENLKACINDLINALIN